MRRAHEASRIPDEAAFEGDRKAQEEGVELWVVEAFAKVLTGGDNDRWLVRRRLGHLFDDRPLGAFAEAAVVADEWGAPAVFDEQPEHLFDRGFSVRRRARSAGELGQAH